MWPSTQARPGLLRLVDAGTNWSTIDTGSDQSSWMWNGLDTWLDAIQTHEPMNVSQVFIFTPCWIASPCLGPGSAPTGTNVPPSDLTASGSPSFNSFVTAFVQHCSPAGNCVKDEIKYYEMWNEWDLPSQAFWTGTPQQLYQMVAPAASIIRQNVPSAVIMTPTITVASPTYQQDLATWLNLENTNGKISDWVAWHVYLSGQNNTSNTPEVQWQQYGPKLIAAKNGVPGWVTAPWANTETNFAGSNTTLNYSCPSTQYTQTDCTGQIVRWQLLHASSGASSLIWFKWNQTIGSVPAYEQAYYYMMQYMEGGKFTAVCASSLDGSGNQIWTCPFTESDGTTAQFVWAITPVEGQTISYVVPAGYTDYKDFSGNKVTVSGSVTIGPEPILLEQ